MYKVFGYGIAITTPNGIETKVDRLFFNRKLAEEAIPTLQNLPGPARIVQLFYHEILPYTEPKQSEFSEP